MILNFLSSVVNLQLVFSLIVLDDLYELHVSKSDEQSYEFAKELYRSAIQCHLNPDTAPNFPIHFDKQHVL